MQANQKYSTSTEAPSLSRVSVKPSSKQVKAEKGRRGHSILATTYQGSPDGEKECPCQPEGSTHRWPPHEYETDLYAVVRAPSPSHGRFFFFKQKTAYEIARSSAISKANNEPHRTP